MSKKGVIYAFFFGAAGLVLVIKGIKAVRDAKKYSKYTASVQNEREQVYRVKEAASIDEVQKTQSSVPVTIVCPNCGANNVGVSGATAVCEYCGAVIQ